ncbi:hypothetical protein [Paenibacillus oceani]|uniref:Uncharacterized protein n=1 Tax=Paenibacillus oceani TaxID=2772510 RepID=A0A927CFS6_9BACL|nr:hypothetical protein [Paenibacillus oceani]MBD2865416.1 hypothetical protein [Paenibacillus oceani]
MFLPLAIFASIVGLFVTGAAVFTAWAFFATRNNQVKAQTAEAADGRELAVQEAGAPPWSWFLRWTVADYSALFLFGFGAVFLIVNLVGVSKDRDLYPDYHFAYLLCGFIFSFLGMLFTFVRLAMVLRLTRRLMPAGDHPHKPDQAQQAE